MRVNHEADSALFISVHAPKFEPDLGQATSKPQNIFELHMRNKHV